MREYMNNASTNKESYSQTRDCESTFFKQRFDSSINIPADINVGVGTDSTSDVLSNYFYQLPRNMDILRDVVQSLSEIVDEKQKAYVLGILKAFQKVLLAINKPKMDLGCLPPISLINLEDKSSLIEWKFKDFRMGFSVEKELSQSSWYLVSNQNLREVSESGDLDPKQFESLIGRLFSYAIRNV